MGTESKLPVDDNNSVRSIRQTTSAGEVDAEVLVVADPNDVDAKQQVKNEAPSGSEYGAIVRNIPKGERDAGATAGVTDTGVPTLGVLQDEASASAAADGSYERPSLTRHRETRTRDQRSTTIQDCNDATDFAALDDNTDNIADAANHLFGSGAVSFDKVDGSANTLIAGIADNSISLNVGELYESGGFVGIGIYLPSVANVANVFLRLGTDASNYQEWQWSDDVLSAGRWLPLRNSTNQPTTFAGNGWDTSDISYVAVGVTFDAETDTLAGIIVDNLHFIGGRVTDSTLQASLSSSVNTPNINVHRVAGVPTGANKGNAGPGTQRVVLASDQPAVATLPEASATTVGITPHFDSDGDNTAQTIKASAGNLYSLSVHNPNGSDAFIQLFDASSPTVGTTTPVQSYYVPPGGGMGVEFPVPMAFATAIKYACTTTATGNTDPTTGLVVNAGYA